MIDVYQGQYDSPDSEITSIIQRNTTSQTTNPSLEPTSTIPERELKVTKATGIPMHVMLLADMQKVIKAQHEFLVKMKILINEEFDKREVGHATFQVQKQVEEMLTSFESRIITKVDAIGNASSSSNKNHVNKPGGSPGKWYYWDGLYRRVPEDWVFPNKMTLRTAFHRYFLFDHTSGVGPLKNLEATDMAKQSNGKRNLSSLRGLMKFMVVLLRSTNSYVNEPTEKDVDIMYRKVAGHVLSLSNSPRAELLSWHSHVRNVSKSKKKTN